MMDKLGQGWEIILASGMIIATLFGVISVVVEGSKVYVGEINTSTYYDFDNCRPKIDSIPQNNVKIFQSEKEALNNGYHQEDSCG